MWTLTLNTSCTSRMGWDSCDGDWCAWPTMLHEGGVAVPSSHGEQRLTPPYLVDVDNREASAQECPWGGAGSGDASPCIKYHDLTPGTPRGWEVHQVRQMLPTECVRGASVRPWNGERVHPAACRSLCGGRG